MRAYETRCQELADACGQHLQAVRRWMSFETTVPLNQLPSISQYLGVSLGVLTALWLSEFSPEQHADALFKAASPVVTDGELRIIELARSVFAEQEDDAADASLFP